MLQGPVLVTGGSGFIGKHLVLELLRRDNHVSVVDQVSSPREFRSIKELDYRKADASAARKIFSGAETGTRIVHLAAKTSVQKSVTDPFSTVRANIGVTCEILELARRIDCERFIFASTAAIYGDRRTSCRETDKPAPNSPYAASKVASEYYCRVYAKLYGVPTVILRYFNIYGPGQSAQYAGVITQFVREILRGKPPVIFGDGSQTRDFIFINDVVKATIASLDEELPLGLTLNIGSGRSTSINSLAERLLDIFRLRNLQPIHAPPRVGEVRTSQADITLARNKIHFRPQYGLAGGLRPTIEWLKKSRRS